MKARPPAKQGEAARGIRGQVSIPEKHTPWIRTW